MEYHEMLQRFVGHRVCVSTFGHLKLWGKLTGITEDCLRLINTSLSGEGDDQWLSQQQYGDEDSTYGARLAETLVHFHHVVAISCMDDDLPAVNLSPPVSNAAESNVEGKVACSISDPPNTRTWENVEQQRKEEEHDPYDWLQVERMELQIGTRLIPLVDPKHGGDLRDRLTHLRNIIGAQLGFLLPVIRIRDNLQLDSEEYRIYIHGAELARGRLEPDRILALGGPQVKEPLAGEAIREPAYSQPAIWILPEQRETAQKQGYFTVEPNTVLVTHVQKIVRSHAQELFTLDALRQHLDHIRRHAPTTVEEVVPQRLPMSRLHDLCTRLLEEEVSIRPLDFILEKVAHLDANSLEMEEMLVSVRIGLGRLICERFRNREGSLPVISLDRALHDHLGTLLTNEPSEAAGQWISQFVTRFREWYFTQRELEGRDIPLVVDTLVRRKIWLLLHQSIPGISVLAFSEIAHDVSVDLLANRAHKTLGLKGAFAPRSSRKTTAEQNPLKNKGLLLRSANKTTTAKSNLKTRGQKPR